MRTGLTAPRTGEFCAAPALRTLSSVTDSNIHGRLARLVPLLGTLSGCSSSPSRNILGSYFPSWMVCALLGLVVALIARAVFKAAGLLSELPAPLVVLLSIGCAATFALWLVWLA